MLIYIGKSLLLNVKGPLLWTVINMLHGIMTNIEQI